MHFSNYKLRNRQRNVAFYKSRNMKCNLEYEMRKRGRVLV